MTLPENKVKLSVIVPTYKVEAYIEKCIRSLEDQNLPKEEYEIIVINDGSPDRCREIVEELQKEFSNIVLINQENQGVSMARNNGIQVAKGDYLLMVDPDDYLVSNCLKERLDSVIEKSLDAGIGSFVFLNESGNPVYKFNLSNTLNEALTGIDFFNYYLKGKSSIKLPDRSWGIFFKRDFILSNKLFYIKDVPYLEDGEFLYRIYTLALKADFVAGPFYIITTRPGSATYGKMVYSEKVKAGFLNSAKNLRMFQKGFDVGSKGYLFLNQPIIKFLILYLTSFEKSWFSHYLEIRKKIKNDFPYLEYQDANPFYAKFAKYYNISLVNFYIRYKTNLFLRSFKLKFTNSTNGD